jgi:hypothetical protein
MKTLVATAANARPEPRDAGWAAAFLDELMAGSASTAWSPRCARRR